MKKNISFLLSALLMVVLIFSANTTFAMETDEFTQMTPQQQYEYLQTLESEEDVQQALNTLSPEQLEALEAYKQSLEQDTDEEPPALPPSNDSIGFADMTPEEQFNYLSALESKDEKDAALKLLTKEQFEALENFVSSLTPDKEDKPETPPAIDYTKAGPIKPPVNVGAMTKAGLSAAKALCTSEDEDALVVDKTVNGSGEDYTITIESYATGEVTITTGETPVPADIIMVLDTSGSMSSSMVSDEKVGINFTYNYLAYNFAQSEDLFVKVNNEYWPVTITRQYQNARYEYTYSYTANGVSTTIVRNYHLGTPPNWNFYEYGMTTRIEALKKAAKNFIDTIEEKANTADGVDHRIAVVSFNSYSYIESGDHTSSGAFVSAYNNASGISGLKNTIDGFYDDGGTMPNTGMENAKNIFYNDAPSTSGLRSRVVIFFTDGRPNHGADNMTLPITKEIKADLPDGCGATIYSIGIFDGANPNDFTLHENKFMHYVSSNFPEAISMTNPGPGGNDGYYLSASNGGSLDDIFQIISDDIVSGGTTVTLDESSVIRDILTPYFELVDVNNIGIYTSEADPTTGAWQPKVPFPQGTATVNADGKTINISGFDYADNYYAAIEEDGVITGYQGKKLIVEIPIRYIDGSCFGGTVPTNEAESGIYDDDTLVEALPIPTVDIPVNYDFTELNKSIYLTQSLVLSDLFAFDPSYIANGVNNAYVDIVYTVKDSSGTVLGTYSIPAGDTSGVWNPSDLTLSGLTSNTTYTVSCTVTPISGPVSPETINKISTAYVFKPTVTYQDTVIYTGETADYNNNFVAEEWKNSVITEPLPSSAPPTLSYTYSPLETVFVSDTHVSTTVKIGATDVTSHVTFIHDSCSVPSCGFNPTLGQFMVHVKTCSLTITKTGAVDPTDTFIFEVIGTIGDNNVTIIVSMQGNASRTIVGLPVGNYTVTEKTDWSWRYTAPSESIELSCLNPSPEVIVTNTLTNNKWLGGDSWIANIFPGYGTEEYN